MQDAPPRARFDRRRRLFIDWLLAALAIGAVLAVASVCPMEWRPRLSHDPGQERFWAFFVLGLAAKFAAPRRHLTILCCVAVFAAATEAAQLLAVDRHARLSDAAVKAYGAMVGVQVGYTFFKLRRILRTLARAKAMSRRRSLPSSSPA